MNLKRTFASVLISGILLLPAGVAFAEDSLDDLKGPSSNSTQTENKENIPVDQFLKENNKRQQENNSGTNDDRQGNESGGNHINNPGEGKKLELPESDPGEVGNFMKGYQPVTGESLAEANQYLGPILGMLSYVISGGILLLTAAVFLITMLDLLYIVIPPVRSFLYTPSTTGTGSQIGGGNVGGGVLGGSILGLQWVSDEAVKAAAVQGGESSAQGVHMQNPYGGGYGMNNPAMSPNQAQKQSRGSVLGTYFRSRLKFMIFLGVSVVLLFSSIFLDFGINLAGMIMVFIQEHLL